MIVILATVGPQEKLEIQNKEPDFSAIGKALNCNIESISTDLVIAWNDTLAEFIDIVSDLDEYGYDKEAKEVIQNKMEYILRETDALKHYIAE